MTSVKVNYGGMMEQQEEQQQQQGQQQGQQSGGRRRARSRRGKGRKGRGGYLMDVISATGLLGATEYAKRRASYGHTGKNGYYTKARRRGSKRGRGTRRRRY
jgi:hypothetical protein